MQYWNNSRINVQLISEHHYQVSFMLLFFNSWIMMTRHLAYLMKLGWIEVQLGLTRCVFYVLYAAAACIFLSSWYIKVMPCPSMGPKWFWTNRRLTFTQLTFDISVNKYVLHSRSKQRTDQRVLVLTYTQIFSPKKTGFSPLKNTSQKFFDFCLSLFYATFQWGP